MPESSETVEIIGLDKLESSRPPGEYVAWVNGGYSPAVHKGFWCYKIGRSAPVMGSVDDPDSVLTNNAMVYHAVLNLFRDLPSDSIVTIKSDARIIVAQLNHKFRVRTERLQPLADEVSALQKSKNLTVSVLPVKLDDNPAAAHLAKQYKTDFGRKLRYEPVEI